MAATENWLIYIRIFQASLLASEMSRWVTASAAKPDTLTLVTGPQIMIEENQLLYLQIAL